MSRFGNIIASVGFLAVSMTAASAQNLIVDGDFEKPALNQATFYQPGATFGGPSGTAWTVTGGGSNVGVALSSTPTGSGTVYNGNSGNQWLDLTGNNDNGSAVGIRQSVATVVGQAYSLTFFVGHKFDDCYPAIIGVSIDGGAFRNFSNGSMVAPGNNGVDNFAKFGFDFTATKTLTTVEFRNGTFAGNRSPVAGLDDVTMLATPGRIAGAGLPVLAGMAGFAFLRRRRAAKA